MKGHIHDVVIQWAVRVGSGPTSRKVADLNQAKMT